MENINRKVADKLLEIAALLEEQRANLFRIRAYQNAANTMTNLDVPVNEIIDKKGIAGLIALPGIGEGIARSIYEYVVRGRMSRLVSLRDGRDPIVLFEDIPGIGATLAHRIVEVLHIDSLEALEVAAHNKRLLRVPGFTEKKVAMVQAWLTQSFGKRRTIPVAQENVEEPPVEMLLQLDRRYRQNAEAGKLPTIAPKRFNPNREAWLPILHTTKGGWHFTALYSNTARAHQLKRVKDWVVIYFYDKHHHESQHTVVTETRGSLIGKRVVRGREQECLEYYADKVD